jgi:hypothetical protein
MPGPDIAAMMAAMQGGQMPTGPAPGQAPMPQGAPPPPSDEDMLAQVQRGMGNEGGPPPGSGMKWENLEEDQQALMNNPTPENVQAFVQYWGEDKLPPELQGQGGGDEPESRGPPEAAEGEY